MGQIIKSVYGQALFDAAIDTNSVDSIYEEFLSLKDFLLDEKKLKILLETPRISTKEKVEIIDMLFKDVFSDIFLNFLKVVTEKRRISYIFDIFDGFKELYREYKDIMVANVTSAEKLTDVQIASLKEKLSKLSGKEVEIYNIIDENVIGGLLIEAEDRIIDGTISSKLLVMKDSLKEIVL